MGAERESGRRIFVSPWPGASMGAEREPHTRFEVFLPRSQDPPPSAVERIWHIYVSEGKACETARRILSVTGQVPLWGEGITSTIGVLFSWTPWPAS
jgi:hypothetical protein